MGLKLDTRIRPKTVPRVRAMMELMRVILAVMTTPPRIFMPMFTW